MTVSPMTLSPTARFMTLREVYFGLTAVVWLNAQMCGQSSPQCSQHFCGLRRNDVDYREQKGEDGEPMFDSYPSLNGALGFEPDSGPRDGPVSDDEMRRMHTVRSSLLDFLGPDLWRAAQMEGRLDESACEQGGWRWALLWHKFRTRTQRVGLERKRRGLRCTGHTS